MINEVSLQKNKGPKRGPRLTNYRTKTTIAILYFKYGLAWCSDLKEGNKKLEVT